MGPQYCGPVGKVANSQVGVYLGYVSRKGYSVVAGRLFTLEQWFDDEQAEKRRACGVPEDLVFKTKPQIALDLLQEALHRGVLPFQWVAADELHGDSPAFRDGVAAMGKWYVTEIACSTLIWRRRPAVCVPPWSGHGKCPSKLRLCTPTNRPRRVDTLVARIPKKSWTRAMIKEGSEGPLVCDFAFLRVTEARSGLPGPAVWLVIRQNVDDPSEVKFYFSNAPSGIPLSDLVRVTGMRWPIESIFEESRGEWGQEYLDELAYWVAYARASQFVRPNGGGQSGETRPLNEVQQSVLSEYALLYSRRDPTGAPLLGRIVRAYRTSAAEEVLRSLQGRPTASQFVAQWSRPSRTGGSALVSRPYSRSQGKRWRPDAQIRSASSQGCLRRTAPGRRGRSSTYTHSTSQLFEQLSHRRA